MTIEKITYEKIFPTGIPYANEKIGSVIIINAGENAMEAIDSARQMAQENHMKAYPQLYQDKTPDVPIIKPKEYIAQPSANTKIGFTADDINSCRDIKTLKIYRTIIDKSFPNDEFLQQAFDNKLKELS